MRRVLLSLICLVSATTAAVASAPSADHRLVGSRVSFSKRANEVVLRMQITGKSARSDADRIVSLARSRRFAAKVRENRSTGVVTITQRGDETRVRDHEGAILLNVFPELDYRRASAWANTGR